MVDNPLTETPALYEAEVAVINYVTSQLKQKIWIHGACLVRDRKIVLLIAPTGTGKTTLSLGLLGHGFKLLTDDVIIINPVEKTVLPYPRCPKIRTPAEVQLNEMGLTVVKDSEVIGNFLILPESFIEKSAQNLVDKEIYVFFLSREEVLNHDTPRRIDYCRAMIELLRHSNLLYQDKQLKGSHHLLSKTAFYNLYINSLQDNLQQILSIASN